MIVILSVVFFAGLLGNGIVAEQTKESVQTIDHPHKNEYASVVAGSDKHKYGYELKENRHFHHTTTEEDGVRLGCYGYVLFGKKYSTQYVADVKGYRPVNTHDLITVYPKSGGERKASFVGDFNEDQQRSENIRYFFPDGCKGTDVMVGPTGANPKIFLKVEEPITPPKLPPAPTPKIPSQPIPPTSFEPPFLPLDPLTPPPRPPKVPPSKVPLVKVTPTPPVTPKITKTTPKTTPKTPTPKPPKVPPQIVTKIPAPPAEPPIISRISPPPKDVCDNTCCSDDDSSAKLVIPIPLKNLGKSGSCDKFAKLVIPVEGLNPESLKSLSKDGSDTSELIKTILKSLA